MSSVPSRSSFLESYTKINTLRSTPQTSAMEKYQKEIHYLEQELAYWKTEHKLSPRETKQNQIEKLTEELKNAKEAYQDIIRTYERYST